MTDYSEYQPLIERIAITAVNYSREDMEHYQREIEEIAKLPGAQIQRALKCLREGIAANASLAFSRIVTRVRGRASLEGDDYNSLNDSTRRAITRIAAVDVIAHYRPELVETHTASKLEVGSWVRVVATGPDGQQTGQGAVCIDKTLKIEAISDRMADGSYRYRLKNDPKTCWWPASCLVAVPIPFPVGSWVKIVKGAPAVEHECKDLLGQLRQVKDAGYIGASGQYIVLHGTPWNWDPACFEAADAPTAFSEEPMHFVHIAFEPGGKVYKYRCSTTHFEAISLGDEVQVDSPFTGKTWVTVIDKSTDPDRTRDWKSILAHRTRYSTARGVGCALYERMDLAIQEQGRAGRGTKPTFVVYDEIVDDDYTNRTTPTTEDYAMIKITNATYVDINDGNGPRDVARLSDDLIFDAIARTEKEIKRLEDIENKPAALTKRIDGLKKGIADLVTLVDARDATKQ